MKINFTYFLLKMKKICRITVFLIFTVFFSFTKIPKPEDIDRRIETLRELHYKKSLPLDKSIKIVLECYKDSKKIKYNDGIVKSGIYLTILYTNKLDFANTIKISNEIEHLVDDSDDYKNLIEYYNSRAFSFSSLGLLADANKEYQKSLKTVKKITNKDDMYYKQSVIYLDLAGYHGQTEKSDEDSIIYYYKKALSSAENISNSGSLAKSGEKKDWIITIHYFLGDFYLESKSPNINLSRKYFEEGRRLYETSKTKMLLGNEIAFLAYLSKFYYRDKNYKEAVYFGLKSLELQKIQSFPIYKQIVYENIAKSYLELGKQEDYQKYINKYIALNDSLEISERNKKAVSIEKVLKKKETDNTKKTNIIIYSSAGIILIIASCFLLLWRHRNKKIHSNYIAIIERLKNEKEIQSTNTELASDEKVNTFNIPEETYHKISAKLERFEKNLGFLKKDITLSYLSNQFKTNPKSLSAVIKSSKNKTFNNYINDLRINYIIHKLYENKQYREFKINYLAEESGFSSPKVFVTAFKKLTSVTPSYYITNLKKDMS